MDLKVIEIQKMEVHLLVLFPSLDLCSRGLTRVDDILYSQGHVESFPKVNSKFRIQSIHSSMNLKGHSRVINLSLCYYINQKGLLHVDIQL